METPSITELFHRCQAKDRKAQEHIFRAWHSGFLKVCLRYAPDRQTAEGLLSDAFFKIFTRVEQCSEAATFEGWMHRIVVNTCLSHIRSATSSKNVLLVDTAEGIGGTQHSYNDGDSRMGLQEVIALIQKLPPVTRAVFNLYIFEGYPHKDIAAHLEMSEGTSHWHLSTARAWLKSKIKKAPHHGK